MKVNKKDLTETEIRTRFITPAITKTAGWDVVQMGEEITLGKNSRAREENQTGEEKKG